MITATDPQTRTSNLYTQEYPNRRPTIALDLDSTLYDFDGHVRTLYRQMHWDQPKCAILPGRARQYLDTRDDTHFERMTDLLQWYTDMQGWYNQPTYTDAITAVYALQQLPNIHLTAVTARPTHASHQTRAALTRDFGPDLDVVITQAPKWTLGYDLYIDDAPDQIEGYINNQCDYLIYDQPWNQGLPGRRVHNPIEIFTAVRWWANHDARPSTVIPSCDHDWVGLGPMGNPGELQYCPRCGASRPG